MIRKLEDLALDFISLPRFLGTCAILLGFVHYLPLPYLPVPWLIDLHADLASELIGIGLTLILIDWAVTRHANIGRKRHLIWQLASESRDVTEMALRELGHEGWLYDGSLSGVSLAFANLSGARLAFANLSGADLSAVNLSGASLYGANLSEANPIFADLSGVTLEGADLRGARFFATNLSGSILSGADLTGTNLSGADLTGADLSGADLSKAKLWGANLSGAYFYRVYPNSLYLTLHLPGNPYETKRARLNSELVINPELWKAIITDRQTLRWKRE